MAIILLIAFVAVPVVEIAVFIEVGGRIGALNTILTVVLTATIGIWLLRGQGLQALGRVQESLNRNVLPVAEVFDGLCLLAAGALLLTPGFVTDAMGFLLFVPPFRRHLRRWVWLWLSRSGRTGVWINGEDFGGGGPKPGGGHKPPGTIEGDFREIEPEKGRKDHGKPPPDRP
jgi:UPF0716 protein FxsA